MNEKKDWKDTALSVSTKIQESATSSFSSDSFFHKLLTLCFGIVLVQKFYQWAGMLVVYDSFTVIQIFWFWVALSILIWFSYSSVIWLIKSLISKF